MPYLIAHFKQCWQVILGFHATRLVFYVAQRFLSGHVDVFLGFLDVDLQLVISYLLGYVVKQHFKL